MPNCKNCYHYHMCDLQYRLEENRECKHFKDESLIVELPCKVGDVVYRIVRSNHTKIKRIQETKVCRIAVDFDGIYIFCQHCAAAKAVLGKTVFLSREEAEKKLKGV